MFPALNCPVQMLTCKSSCLTTWFLGEINCSLAGHMLKNFLLCLFSDKFFQSFLVFSERISLTISFDSPIHLKYYFVIITVLGTLYLDNWNWPNVTVAFDLSTKLFTIICFNSTTVDLFFIYTSKVWLKR